MKKIFILTMIIVGSVIFESCNNTPNTTQGDTLTVTTTTEITTTEITTTQITTAENLTDYEKIRNYMLDNGGLSVGIMGVPETGYRIMTDNNSGCVFEYDLYPSGQVYLRLFKTLSNDVVAKVEVNMSFVLSGTDTEEVNYKLEIYSFGRGMYDATDESVMVRSNVFDTIDISYETFPSTDILYLESANAYAECLWNEYLRINDEALNQK